MLLATTVLLLAALLPSQKPIAVDVALHPRAVISQQESLDLKLVETALARKLAETGIDVVTSPDVPRLKVQIMIVRVKYSFPARQTATIAAYAQLLEAAGAERPSPLSLQAASCTASAGSGRKGSSGQGAQSAIARCIDQLAGQISSRIVRLRKTKFVG